jgi:hypothetical protein
MKMNITRTIVSTFTAVSLATASHHAVADPIRASVTGSVKLSQAVGNVFAIGAEFSFYAGAALVIAAVKTVGGVVHITLNSVRGVAVATIAISEAVLHAGAVAVGTTVAVVAHGAGYAISHGDTMLAFVPNTAAQILLHSSRSS